MHTTRKREGFEGQRAIVLPKKVIEVCANTAPVNSLFVTDIGFYPNAAFHYRERPGGIAQNILIYCVDGKGWLELPSGKYKMNPNEFLIIPADMPHKYGADEKTPWSIYWAHFKGIQALYFVNILSRQNKDFVMYCPFLEERIRVFDSIYKALESGYSIDNLNFASMAFTYFLALLSYSDKFTTSHRSSEKDAVDLSIEYMQNHLEKSLMLESIASSVNLSVSQYSSTFRKRTGYSPIEYFNHLKVQHACQYLQFTTLRISEISLKLGIDDAYYFSRMFTKVMGMSPLEYRNKKH
ncbi:MAG: AraC family transcriptional regulator [Chryseolinea sp.]